MFNRLHRSTRLHVLISLMAWGSVMIMALLVTGTAFAQEVPPVPDVTKLPDLLQWFSIGGSAVAAAALLSFLSEKVPAFKDWDNPLGKLALQAGVSAVLGLGSLAILTYVPAETLAQIQPWFLGFMVSVLPVLGNAAWHQLVNAKKEIIVEIPPQSAE